MYSFHETLSLPSMSLSLNMASTSSCTVHFCIRCRIQISNSASSTKPSLLMSIRGTNILVKWKERHNLIGKDINLSSRLSHVCPENFPILQHQKCVWREISVSRLLGVFFLIFSVTKTLFNILFDHPVPNKPVNCYFRCSVSLSFIATVYFCLPSPSPNLLGLGNRIITCHKITNQRTTRSDWWRIVGSTLVTKRWLGMHCARVNWICSEIQRTHLFLKYLHSCLFVARIIHLVF